MILDIVKWVVAIVGLIFACYIAFDSRLHAVTSFGRVIHEFDPYFNLRATEYLVDNGWNKFINWFDDRTWYPLGRPVGTTIYPGLQITAWLIYIIMNKYLNIYISINDVCVFIPAWFSILACISVFGIAYEATKAPLAGAVAAAIMAVIPAHIMRSVAGGYDNESIAMAAMCSTFYFWMVSIRNKNTWWVGSITAISYIYMVAAWGGYVFVLNMIGVHAIFMVFIGGYTSQLHRAYSLFYVFGTLGAIQWPVVGLAPLKSLEQLGPMLVFFVLQLLFVFQLRRQMRPNETMRDFRMFQLSLLGVLVAGLAIVVGVLAPMGYFGPLSSRVRGLFIRHTHTGNPLVDSVAEHQATQDGMYWQFFHSICFIAPLAVPSLFWKRSEAKYFLFVYAAVALYFSKKMNRLVLLLAPAASVLAGIAVSGIVTWSFVQVGELVDSVLSPLKVKKVKTVTKEKEANGAASTPVSSANVPSDGKNKKKEKDKKSETASDSDSVSGSALASVNVIFAPVLKTLKVIYSRLLLVRVVLGVGLVYLLTNQVVSFWGHSTRMAVMLSNPSIILQGQTQDGRVVMLDDFREAYWWIRDNTPEDARVMSW